MQRLMMVILALGLSGLSGCQSSGLGATALAHAHQTLEGPSDPGEAAAWQRRAQAGSPEDPSGTEDAPDAAAVEGEADAAADATAPAEPVVPPIDAARLFRENAAQLFRMSWQTRTRLQFRGAEVLEVLHKVQIDENGDLKRRVLSSRQRSSVVLPGETETEMNWEADAETLSDLIYAYTVTSMGAVSRAFEDQTPVAKPGGLRTLTGTDAVIPGDQVALDIFLADELKTLSVDTLLENGPVQATVHYRKLPHGPAYPARAQIQWPARELQATVESFSFRTF